MAKKFILSVISITVLGLVTALCFEHNRQMTEKVEVLNSILEERDSTSSLRNYEVLNDSAQKIMIQISDLQWLPKK